VFDNLKAANLKRFNAMHVTLDFKTLASRLVAAKDRYKSVEQKSGVPWPIIAAIHEREASQSFHTQLAQGDPLDQVSTHVPRGQGPYFGADAWERAAGRALIETRGQTWGDWTPGGWTTYLEKYNGLGYANKGKPSPYVWAGTNQYHSGKYIADGVYSDTAVDTQPGCVALIVAMSHLDPTINLNNLASTVVEPTKENKMFNWKTTVAGISAIFAAIGSLFAANGSIDWTHFSTVFPAILTGLGLIFAKDMNVTGGMSIQPSHVVVTPAPVVVPKAA
jgi:lysozyme family protein